MQIQSEQQSNIIENIIININKTAKQNRKRDEKVEDSIMNHKDRIHKLKQIVKMQKRTCKQYERNRNTVKFKDDHDRINTRNRFLLEKVGKLQREVVKLREEKEDENKTLNMDKCIQSQASKNNRRINKSEKRNGKDDEKDNIKID